MEERKKVYLNPPPKDGKCYRCYTHVSELKAFGKEGDPLVGNFEGAKLVKTFRALVETDDIKLDKILEEQDEMIALTDNKEWSYSIQEALETKYGAELIDQAYCYDQAKSTVGASWECRDCIVL